MGSEQVLAIRKALSIQAHPDKELAKRLHEEKPDVYKGESNFSFSTFPHTEPHLLFTDPNHKV